MPAEFAVVPTAPLWLWGALLAFVLCLIVFDLGVLHRHAHRMGLKECACVSAGFVTIGLSVGGLIWWLLGPDKAFAYWTGYLVEQSLSLDNIFVIALIFSFFSIPREYQHRVLFWGILGVIVLRGAMILAGAALVARFDWILLVFAAFLVYTGVRLLMAGDETPDFAENRVIRFLRRRIRITDELHGERFVTRVPEPGTGRMVLAATPLLLALIVIELADLVFAVDSIPAIFLVTTDPFIVFASNIFAVIGLRAMFFVLAAALERFRHLKPALALLLVVIGSKVLIVEMTGIDHVPHSISLGITLAILGGGVAVSLMKSRRPAPGPRALGE